MQHTTQSANGREIHFSINPALAGFDLALRRTHPPIAGQFARTDERATFLARAQVVVARTHLFWI
jgi:hypothetical protein